MKYCLVTGGAGFIGSNIVEGLLKEGRKVRILDDLSTGLNENIKPFEKEVDFIQGDIRDKDVVKRAMKDVEYVFHLAASRAVEKSVQYPDYTHEINVTGTLNLLLAARDEKVKRFVFTSSSAIYGEITKFPVNEIEPDINPQSPYGLSKLIGEQYCRLFSEIYDLDTVSLRYFNVFGPRQNRESQYAVVVPVFIDCLLKKESPEIHWDGKQSRDFVYIGDVVKANLACMRNDDFNGEVYNIASGQDISVLDLFNLIAKQMNVTDIKPNFAPKRPGDVRKTLADIEKAKKDLGYQPNAKLDEDLIETINWFVEKFKSEGLEV